MGRILRQPFAKKTKVKDLDECYVFTFRQNARTLVADIKKGLEEEGLGDFAGRISSDDAQTDTGSLKERGAQVPARF